MDLLATLFATPLSGSFAELLLTAALHVSLLLGFAGLVTVGLRRRSAASRHLVWALGLSAALALPMISFTLPWRLPVVIDLPAALTPARHSTAKPAVPAVLDAGKSEIERAGSMGRGTALTDGSTAHNATPSLTATEPGDAGLDAGRGSGLAWDALSALFLWLGIAALLLLRYAFAVLGVRRLIAGGTPVDDAERTRALARSARRAGVVRPVRMLWVDGAASPLTWGVRKPAVLFPHFAASWSLARLELVLDHEMAHVRRGDVLSLGIARVARALYWFNPLVWFAEHQLRSEAERAADDAVLRGGALPSDYAGHLIEIVSTQPSTRAPVPAVPFAQRSTFEGRMIAILASTVDRSGVRPRAAVSMSVAALALVTVLSAMAPGGSPVDPGSDAGLPEGDAVSAALEIIPEGPQVAPKPSPAAAPPRAEIDAARFETAAPVAETAFAPEPDRAPRSAQSQEVDARAPVVWSDADHDRATDPRSVAALSEALRTDSEVEVRRAAAWALGQLESADAVPALAEALRTDADEEVRSTAAWALGQIGSVTAIDGLIDALQDTSVEVRQRGVWALGQIESERSVDGVVGALADSDVEVRKLAAWALGQIGSDRSVDALSGALQDEEAVVRSQAARAIGQIEPDVAPPALVRALQDDSPEVRQQALRALGQIEDPSALDAVRGLAADQDPEVRQLALRILASSGDPESLAAIADLLKDPDPEIRAWAARTLGGGSGGWVTSAQSRPRARPRPGGEFE